MCPVKCAACMPVHRLKGRTCSSLMCAVAVARCDDDGIAFATRTTV